MVTYRNLREGDGKKVLEILQDLSVMFDSAKFDEESLLKDENCHCVVVEKEGSVVGFGAIVIYRTPSQGIIGRVEDVIVNERYRGMGLGRGIMENLIKIANERDVSIIYLTSNPARVVARKLYESLGFVTFTTDVFKLKLK